jgi:hypothetical protein
MTITAEAADYDLGKQSKADAEEACESLQDINVILDPAATCEL